MALLAHSLAGLALLAQAGFVGTIGFWAIMIVIVIGIVALVWVAVQATGVQIPGWVIQVFWILVVVVVVVLAIKLLMSLF